MNIESAFPSKYLKAADLNGHPVKVTLNTWAIEEVGQKREQKLVVYFQGKQKGFVLNKTNAKMIAKIAGSLDTDQWSGTTIVLVPTEVEFQGDLVESIRVRAVQDGKPVPKPVEREPGEDDLSDVGF